MAFPDVVHQPSYHNPFPQLHRVAVLPFNNLSHNPYVNADQFAESYVNELQQVQGFEVVPVPVTKAAMINNRISGDTIGELRRLAQILGVDAVVVGAVTDFDPYYPPRLGLAVNWFAANPGFHPIPPGYGLPWGTSQEEFIPQKLVDEAEFALAREQLKSQTPVVPPGAMNAPADRSAPPLDSPQDHQPLDDDGVVSAQMMELLPPSSREGATGEIGGHSPPRVSGEFDESTVVGGIPDSSLPTDWPHPAGFIPPHPRPVRPVAVPYHGPIIEQVRAYNGNDPDVTTALQNYYYLRDDGRFGGWQGYLQRSDDFIRFCCHLHISEMLSARGGAGETRVVYRWPIGRYER